jgi:hypothetical protein
LFEQNPQYTCDKGEWKQIWHQATKKGIEVNFLNKGTHVLSEGDHQFYLSNEHQYRAEIDALGLEEIYYDSILQKH